jgi:hypothetical protein
MRKGRISGTDEIVQADDLLKLYPNYNDLVFVCIDEKCSVRMAPACIKKKDHRKPHFKKYRNQEHIETCEYATLSKLYQKGKNQKLNKTEIKKIGYPSVFDLNEDKVEVPTTSQGKYGNDDDGVTGRGDGVSKVYEFDGENVKFDRSNRVQGIDRIVDWYLGFPHNRDVEIEINSGRIQYRYFFKHIKDFTDPANLQNERIFYGRIILSEMNRNVFDRYTENVFFKLLGYKDKNEKNVSNYSVKIDKNSISKHSLSRLKNRYNHLFEKAFTEHKNKTSEQNVGLYIFVYGKIDEHNDTLLNVKRQYITFRYDEIRKTIIEE